jgi:hypothetical protein
VFLSRPYTYPSHGHPAMGMVLRTRVKISLDTDPTKDFHSPRDVSLVTNNCRGGQRGVLAGGDGDIEEDVDGFWLSGPASPSCASLIPRG